MNSNNGIVSLLDAGVLALAGPIAREYGFWPLSDGTGLTFGCARRKGTLILRDYNTAGGVEQTQILLVTERSPEVVANLGRVEAADDGMLVRGIQPIRLALQIFMEAHYRTVRGIDLVSLMEHLRQVFEIIGFRHD